ncbi:unnamed protein product [Rhizophagus irregularis]|nr:unnamed protein product [Rhizophagus irregularis]
MSNIYIQEPHTNGKVILHTTSGDIAIELFSKEAPKACRNFVQLALESYFDNTIFHRVVPGFIIQGGDPTGTGHGGESIYGELEIDENERPLYRLKITSTEVVWNPFDDIIPRITVAEKLAQEAAAAAIAQREEEQPRKKKLKKNVALLSFGDEADDYSTEVGNANVEQSKLQDKMHNNINKKNKSDDDLDDNADTAEEFDRKMKENIRQQQESMKLKKESKSAQLSKSETISTRN